MRPVQAALSRAMGNIKVNIIEKAADATGMEIKYSSIRPSFSGTIDVRNLRLIKKDVTVLSMARARISFSPIALLRGKNTALKSILLDRPAFRLDLDNDADKISFFSREKKETSDETIGKLSDLLPPNVQLKIRNCLFIVYDKKKTVQLRNMNIDIAGADKKYSIEGRALSEVIYTSLFNRTVNISTEMNIDGVYSINPQEASANFSLLSMKGTEQLPSSANERHKPAVFFEANPLNISLALKDNLLTMRSDDNRAYSLACAYDIESSFVDASVISRDFLLADIVKFSGASEKYNRLLSQPVTGSASFKYENPGVQYSVDFKGGKNIKKEDSFVVRASGSEKNIAVDELAVYSFSNAAKGLWNGNFGFSGRVGFVPFSPSGTVFFERFSLTGDDEFNAVFDIANKGNEIKIAGEKVSSGKNVFDNFDFFIFPSKKDFGFSVSALCEDEKGSVNLDAILNLDPKRLEASLSLDSFSLDFLSSMARPFVKMAKIPAFGQGVLASSSINADVFVTTDFNHLVYNAPVVEIKNEDTIGVFSFSGTDRQFTLSESAITKNEKDFIVSAQVNFSNPVDLLFSFNANYQDLSWQIEGQLLDRSTLIIRDPNGLHAYGSISNSGAVSGYLEGIDFPIPLDTGLVYTNFYIALRYTTSDFWSLDIARFDIRDSNSSDKKDVFHFSGAADQDGGSFRNILYSDSKGELAGSADFSWDSDFSYLQFVVNMTDGYEAGEYYYTEGMFKDDRLDVNMTVSDMRLDRFVKDRGRIQLNGQASLSWYSYQSFNAFINVTSLYTVLDQGALQASAAITFTNDELTVNEFEFNYANTRTYLPVLHLSRAENYFKANAGVHGYLFGKRLEGLFEFNANFAPSQSWLDIKQAFGFVEGSIKTENIQYGDSVQEPFALVFSRNYNSLSVSGGPKNMLNVEMEDSGDFFARLSSPFPLQCSIAGSYKDGLLDASCGDFYLDLSSLWSMLPPVPNFNISGGYITAKLDIKGPLLDPQFFGNARGTSLRFQVPGYVNQDIKPVPFNAILEGNEMSFSSVPTVIGNGGGTVDGWLRFENWVPKNLGLDISIPKESPIPYSLNITGFLADGDVSGRLIMALENSYFVINGDLLANNTEMGLSIDELMQARQERETPQNLKVNTIANFKVTTGSMVEFIWPNTSMPILRANPEMGTVLLVFADTQSGQYSLVSDVALRSGEVYYFDRSFYIRRGKLVFRESEQQFAPRLSARAEIRDRTDTGQVTISMIIDNEPLLSFVPRFEASPILTQLEIYSLLGQHSLNGPSGDESIDSIAAQRLIVSSTTDLLAQFAANSEFLSQFVAVRQFERQVRNFLNLDMFSVRTRVLQNTVTNAFVLGQTPVDRNNRVGNYFDNTTVFVGKYVGQDMFVQGMLSMRYDENNPDFGGLRFEPDIGIELQSPLFNIRWDFFPYHPENWYVNDNSITLTWSMSF